MVQDIDLTAYCVEITRESCEVLKVFSKGLYRKKGLYKKALTSIGSCLEEKV